MKRLKQWAGVLMCSVALAVLAVGCASAEKVAFKATSVSYTTVDAAMTAWGAYVAQYHPSAAQEQQVFNAYNQYQATAKAVADAGLAYRKAVDAGGNATGVKAALDQALATASASLAGLVNVLAQFGITLKLS